MTAKVNFPSYTSWSFQEYSNSAEDQSQQEEQVEDQGSISFGRYTVDSLSWENKSIFTHNRRQEELDKLTFPGIVAQKKAYFEQYYKKIRLLKGLDQEETNQQPQSQTSIQTEISNEIQTSIRNVSDLDNFEIDDSSVCLSEVAEGKGMREIESNNIVQESVPSVPVVTRSPVVPPVCLVRRRSMEKVEHEKKLAHAFDSLSKDWVKLKKGMAPIRRNKRVESENCQNFEKLKHGMTSAIKRSFGTVKEIITNSQKKRVSNLDGGKISPKTIKEPKPSLRQSPKFIPKTTRIGTTGTKSRPGTKPKSSIGTKNIRKDEVTIKGKPVSSCSNGNKKKSPRSSWEKLMRPTAASSARANMSEVKTSVGINKTVVHPRYKSPLRKEASKPVPPKHRSFGLLSSKKPSEKALRASEKKNQERKVINAVATRRVVPINSRDSSIRPRKVVSVASKIGSKLSSNSSLDNKKKQRPAWR